MSDNAPAPQESPAAGTPVPQPQFDPELVTHIQASIILKNASIAQDRLQEGIVSWRSQFFEGGQKTLLQILFEMGEVPKHQVAHLRRASDYAVKRRKDKAFGKRAFHKGFITKTQLDESLAFQKQLFKALHEVKRLEVILKDDGFISDTQIREVWEEYADFEQKRQEKGFRRPVASVWRAAASAGIEATLPVPEPVKLAIPDDDSDKSNVTFEPIAPGSEQEEDENFLNDIIGEIDKKDLEDKPPEGDKPGN